MLKVKKCMSKRIQKVFDQTHELLSNIAQIRTQKEMVEMVAKKNKPWFTSEMLGFRAQDGPGFRFMFAVSRDIIQCKLFAIHIFFAILLLTTLARIRVDVADSRQVCIERPNSLVSNPECWINEPGR